jgi:hypothetical protein
MNHANNPNPMKTKTPDRTTGVTRWLWPLLLLPLFAGRPAQAQDSLQTVPHVKPRLVVMTDLSNEPDDEESFVRLLVY